MIKEIGGEFYKNSKLNLKKNGIFDLLNGYNYQLFESGREAFEIINKVSNKKILFPSYACDSMFQFLNKENLVFYNVDSSFNIDIKDIERKVNKDVGILIFINYFGKLQGREVFDYFKQLKQKGIIIVEDTTHSFFTEVCAIGDYCVASLRKWFCIPNGGILYSKNSFSAIEINENNFFNTERKKAFILKEKYLLKNNIRKEKFLKIFNKTEEFLDENKKINTISKDSLEILKKIDVENLIKKRKKNYNYLYKKIIKISEIKIYKINTKIETPLFLVIKLKNNIERDNLHNFLIKNKIYCPIHWPLIEKLNESFEVKDFIKNIISIPIDQRYSKGDMNYIYKTILKYYREK